MTAQAGIVPLASTDIRFAASFLFGRMTVFRACDNLLWVGSSAAALVLGVAVP